MMDHATLTHFVLIPALICCARVCDVTLGTIRIMYLTKGMKVLAALLGFLEVSVWLFAIGQVLHNLTNYLNYIAYATGYALGNYIGICIEEKLSIGTLMLRIITKRDANELIAFLKAEGYGLTNIKAEGAYGPVDIIFTIIRRKNLKELIEIIKRFNPNAFYTVEDVKFVNNTPFPLPPKENSLSFRRLGKGKKYLKVA
ncbi:MAG: hypothetical protein BWK80_33840 [Desulfobacteraceae bacterium IS3]|nr:MAG: hypothetical protein BWK80_33840 [Desulfobacteraceae bacterium IS3]